jgi:endonuclease-3 related protein
LHWRQTLKLSREQQQLRLYYRTLLRTWGRQHWWPARSRFEVIVGAYLTQDTAWTNVERALHGLRAAGVLSMKGIRAAPLPQLEGMIRSAGYFRQKARRLKQFVAFLDDRYGASLSRMFASPTGKLREELLALEGIGPETADSILLYAGQRPVFVVDAYTRRVFDRHGILPTNASYEHIRSLVEHALAKIAWREPARKDGDPTGPATPWDPAAARGKRRRLPGAPHPRSLMSAAERPPLAQVYNEMHALIVGVGKHYCLKSGPRCEACPLRQFLPK